MDIQAILKTVDHTLLRPEATWPQIKALCDEGVRYGVATVCVPRPMWPTQHNISTETFRCVLSLGFPMATAQPI